MYNKYNTENKIKPLPLGRERLLCNRLLFSVTQTPNKKTQGVYDNMDNKLKEIPTRKPRKDYFGALKRAGKFTEEDKAKGQPD